MEEISNRGFFIDKKGSRLTFVEKKKNLFYLIARAKDELLIANYMNDNSNMYMVNNGEETDDDMPELNN